MNERSIIISLDPGTARMGVAVFNDQFELMGLDTIKALGFESDLKREFEEALSELIFKKYKRTVGDAIVLIELPSPRYYGRPSISIIKLLHQIVYMVQTLSRWADGVHLIDSYDWNYKDHGNKGRQYSDQEKKELFLETFPEYSRTNTDVRDAALMACWCMENKPELFTDDYET